MSHVDPDAPAPRRRQSLLAGGLAAASSLGLLGVVALSWKALASVPQETQTLTATPLSTWTPAVPSPAGTMGDTTEQPAATATPAPRRPASAGMVLVDEAWLDTMSPRVGISRVALRGYAQATLTLRKEQPSCKLGWNTLAGIGWVETRHGTIEGRTVSAAGVPSTPIVGPALDGNGFAAIPDTDEGVLDGDTTWDRAVGPLQFIPSTWKDSGRDANGDGVRDPQQFDDAALSAAGYLCASGGNLNTAGGWSSAVLGYNRSQQYLDDVRDAANAYAARSEQALGDADPRTPR